MLFVLTMTLNGISQKDPIKFGDVGVSDLEMKTYDLDTTAPAVILCDFGHFNSQTVKFTRILRIKILKKEGYSWANYSIPGTLNSRVRGITFNLENGKRIQEKLRNESIFSDRITGDRYNLRVAMPDVKVGSVLDLEFIMDMIPSSWKFQDLIPVKYSELRFDWSQFITLRSNFFGFEKLEFTSPTRWIAKEMPSFKVEPYMNSQENYLTKLEFNILKFFNHDYASTWEAVSKTLLKGSDFGTALMGSGYLNNLSRNISESKKPKEEMIKMACDSVRKMIKWNEIESVLPSSPSLNLKLKMKTGNSSDINLILIQLLKKLNIETIPVVLSTRNNGLLSPFSPSLEKLNYVIAMSKIGDNTYLTDATDPYLPYSLLPIRCLNFEGRTVNENQSERVNLSTLGKDKKVAVYDIKIEDDKTYKGNISIQHCDYSASEFRKRYSKYNSSEDYLEEFKKDKPGLIIFDLKTLNLDSIYLPVTELFEVVINNQANNSGNEINISPLLYEQVKVNPFKMEERKFPVDYGCKLENTVIVNYTIPENYAIVSMPAKVILRMEGNQAIYQYDVTRIGPSIKVLSKFAINKTLFMPEEYKELKEFYNQVILKQAEPITIKKN
jgi:hypothetical protein